VENQGRHDRDEDRVAGDDDGGPARLDQLEALQEKKL
jgi:hypothetical protein